MRFYPDDLYDVTNKQNKIFLNLAENVLFVQFKKPVFLKHFKINEMLSCVFYE